jgi:hypothetical protein
LKVVAITFAGDALAGDVEKLLGQLGATSYWHTVTSEYGVGPLTALKPVHLTETPPAMLADQDIQTWLAGKLDGTHPEFPAYDPSTIYAIFYPAATTITLGGGQSCQVFGGYHSEAQIKAAEVAVYAVLPRCSDPSASDLELLTSATSHELVEAVEDPHPMSDPAFAQVDDAHFMWERVNGGSEAGDLCAQLANADITLDGLGYSVQRCWSNIQAAAGHDPCVPAAQTAYFNAAPATQGDDLTLSFGGQSLDTKGWTLPVGQSVTIPLNLFSDGPTADWTVTAIDLTSKRTGRAPTLQFQLMPDHGQNGTTLQLIVTPTAPSPSRSGTSTFEIRSQLGADHNFWLGLVKTQ